MPTDRCRLLQIICLQLCLATACQGGGGASDGGVDPEVVPGATNAGLRSYAEAVCEFYERCDSMISIVYGDGDECVEAYLLAITPQTPLVGTLDQCAGRLQQQACPADGTMRGLSDAFFQAIGSCSPVKLAGDGERCGRGPSCMSGLVCHGAAFESCGVCGPPRPSACESVFDCPNDAYCDDVGGTCEKLGQTGAACDSHSQCLDTYCADGICTARAAPGEACDDLQGCALWHYCIDGVCVAPGGEGAQCAQQLECRLLYACHHGSCVAQAPTDNPLGGPCSSIGGCVAGARCDDGECVQGNPLGEPCASGQCADDAFCNGDALCELLRAEGEPCDDADACESPSCREGRCAGSLTCR